MAEKEVGKVTHYYGKIMVAVIKLAGKLSVGDNIKIVRGEEESEMTVESIQIDHEAVKSGKKGDEVAIKLAGPTKEGAVIYKVS